ncbi:4203_t:CDS:10, partial [Scutellospora calospora]
QMNNTSFLQTNNAYNLPLSYTSDNYNSPLLHTDNAYDSFTDTYFNNIIASENILDDFGEQQISENAFDNFNNEADFEDEDEEMEPEPRYLLTVNQSFKTWKAVDELLEHYSQEKGFAFCITHSEIDKVDKEPRHRVYTYTKGQTYMPRKEAHILNKRDRARYCQLTKEMQDDVRLLSSCSMQAGTIIEVLQKKYLEKHIYAHNIYNIIHAIRFENCVTSDAGSTYIELIKKQCDEPGYYVNARFHDVVLMDTTFKTNRYSIMLCMLIIIDNHNRSRLVATAVISDETSDTFSWIFENLLEASNSLTPKVLFTDADCAITTQRVESYNRIIKKHVNGSSSLLELSNTIERLLFKKDQYQRFNEVAGVLPAIHNEDYYNRYFNLVDKSYQKFLTTAILKIQCCEMNLSIHYQAQLVNLTDGLQSPITDEISAGEFSDDLFDAFVIELEKLISDLNHTRIHEIWKVSSIDMKSQYFVVLYDEATHLCTCLTLINRAVVCRHFFAIMMVSKVAKFHVGNISHRWYLDKVVCEEETKINNELANSIINNGNFGSFMHSIQVNFAYLDSIRGRYEELYEMHLNLMKEMEIELVTEDNHNMEVDNIKLFAASISNPVGIHSKSRKWKGLKEIRIGINENLARQENCCSICDQTRPNSCTCNLDVSNNQMDDVNKEGFNNMVNHSYHKNKSRHCGVCGQIGYNARTCNLDSSSKQINNLFLEGYNHKNEIKSLLSLSIASKNGGDLNLMSSVDKDLANNKSRYCGTCEQVGHNAHTYDVKR